MPLYVFWALVPLVRTALLIAVVLKLCRLQRANRDRRTRAAPRSHRDAGESEAGAPVSFTGRIEALDEAALGFRISGRMIERAANVGDQVKPGQLLGRLDPANEMNALRAAKANLASAEAKLVQVTNHFERQMLLGQGWTTRANFDQAEREMKTAQAQVEAAEAQLEAARDQVSFTELKADAEGVVTAVGRYQAKGDSSRAA